MAEPVIVSRHQMHSMIALHQNLRDKILPRGRHHLMVKGDHDDLVDAVEIFGEPRPVLRGVDQGHRHTGDHLLGRLCPCEHGGTDAPALCLRRRAAQQGAVPQMHTVKKAQCDYFRLNGHSLCSKKILDRCQRTVLGTGQAQKFAVCAVYPVRSLRHLRRDGIAVADALFLSGRGQAIGGIRREQRVCRPQ